MFQINAGSTQFDANKPQRMQVYLPHACMGVTPFVGLDFWSDNATPCEGSGYPDGTVNSTINASANIGTVTTMMDKYRPGQIFHTLFGYDSRSYNAAASKRFTFAPFFNKYNRFKNVSAYSYQKDFTLLRKISGDFERTSSYPEGCIIREISSTKFIWVYPFTTSYIGLQVGTIAADGTITLGTVQIIQANHQSGSGFYDCVATDTDQFVLIYRSFSISNTFMVQAGTISGTTITLGTAVAVNTYVSAAFNYCGITKIANGKFAATYCLTTGGLYTRAGTVSGATITLGTEVTVLAGAVAADSRVSIVENGTDNFVLYSYAGGAPQIYPGTVSGTTITMGSVVSSSIILINGNSYGNLKKIAANKFLGVSTTIAQIFTVASNVITAGPTYVFPVAINSTRLIYEITADSSYALFAQGGVQPQIISISGTTITYPKGVSDYSFLSSTGLLSTNFISQGYTQPTAYSTLAVTPCGMGMVGSFLLYFSSPAANLLNYIVGKGNSTFEFYNDATLIGSAVTFVVPFMRYVFSIDSAVYNTKSYLKVKNTSADSRSLLIETVVMEVD